MIDDAQIVELIKNQAQTGQLVLDMHTRLFGNGQPGVLQMLHEADKSVDIRVSKLETTSAVTAWKLGTMSAFAGAALATGVQYLRIKLKF